MLLRFHASALPGYFCFAWEEKMITITRKENLIYANRHEILDLKNPFQNLQSRKRTGKSFSATYLTPNQTLDCPRIKQYLVPINRKLFGSSFARYRTKTHGIYKINQKVSRLFGIKAVETLLENLTKNDKVYLSRVLELLWKSYDFDFILTDIVLLKELIATDKILQADWILERSERVLKPIIEKYELPLNYLVSSYFRTINLEKDTNFTGLPKVSSVLVIISTNQDYTSFLSDYLRKKNIEVLPVTLFVF